MRFIIFVGLILPSVLSCLVASQTVKIFSKYKGAIKKENLKNLPSIRELCIESSHISEIEQGALCGPPNLEKITIKHNAKLPKLTKSIFLGCNNLKTLEIIRGDIEDEAFSGISNNIRVVILNGVKFTRKLNKRTLLGLETTQNLEITGLSIFGVVNSNAFDDLRNLKTLNLSTNNIEHINTGTFKNLENLEELDLSFNPLLNDLTWNEFQGLKSLKILDLRFYSGENLDKIAKNLPKDTPKLEELNMDLTQNIQQIVKIENELRTQLPNFRRFS